MGHRGSGPEPRRGTRLALPIVLALLLPAAVLIARAALRRDVPPTPPGAQAVFTDVSIAAGIDTRHDAYRTGAKGARGAYGARGYTKEARDRAYLTTGQAWGDYDRDGWVDLYLTDQTGPNTLYRNLGNGTFEVSSLAPDLALPDHRSGGAIFADYDNDGWPDLYVVGFGADHLFRNAEGKGFVDVTRKAGISHDVRGMTAAWGDYDRDGFLDLFVASYGCGVCTSPFPDALDPDLLYHNEGDGTFTDVSTLLPSHEAPGASFVGGWLDYDRDGDIDLYITRDVVGTRNRAPSVLLRNDGPGCGGWCFADVSRATGADVRMDAMGLAVTDYDNDGDLDVFASNSGWTFTPLTGPAVLLRNDGARFTEVAGSTGAAVDAVGWGTTFIDYDNDGWKDIYIVVGLEDPAYFGGRANQDRLLHALGDGTFEEATPVAGIERVAVDTLGAATADFNRDGWPDLIVGHFDDRYALYANAATAGSGNHRLTVDLEGAGRVNRDAVGALVEVTTSRGTQLQQVMAGSSLGAGSDLTLHFGLGAESSADVTITWPDGRVDEFAAVPADVHWRLTYGGVPQIVPLSAPAVPKVPAQLIGDASVRSGGLIVPLLTLLTSLGLAIWLFARRSGRPGLAAASLRMLLIWSVAFQVGHLIEHFAQMGYWFTEPSRPPFVTPWGRVATDGFTALVGNHGGRASGTELLHLAGNWIFLAGLIPAFVVSRRSVVSTRGRRAISWAFYLESFHVVEHISLTATWFLLDRPIGMSTLFGWTSMLERPWPQTIRPWWHFMMNLLPTIAAVIAVVRFDFSRLGAPGVPAADRPQTRLAPGVYAMLDAATWPTLVAVATASQAALRGFAVDVGGLVAFGALALAVQLVAGFVQGIYRRRTDASSLKATAVCWGIAAAVLAVVVATRGWIPRAAFVFAAIGTLALMLAYRKLDSILERRRGLIVSSRRPVVVAGAGGAGTELARRMLADPFTEFDPVAVLDDGVGPVDEIPVASSWEELAAAARDRGAGSVLVALSGTETDDDFLESATGTGLDVSVVTLDGRRPARVPIRA